MISLASTSRRRSDVHHPHLVPNLTTGGALMYRMVDCATWDDPWFEALHPKGKLFFLYLLTNPRSTSCGAFEITPRKMAFETGLTLEDVEGFLEAWAPRVQWFPEHQIVFLKNFYRRQTNSEKVRINAARIVASYPIAVQRAIAIEYPELIESPDTLSIPHTYPTDKQDVTETETKQDGDETPPLPPKGKDEGGYTQEFDDFWREYPRVVNNSKVKAFRAWRNLSDEGRHDARDALPRFKASDGWVRGFAPHTSTFLNGKLWEADQPDKRPAVMRSEPRPPRPPSVEQVLQPRKALSPEKREEILAWRQHRTDSSTSARPEDSTTGHNRPGPETRMRAGS